MLLRNHCSRSNPIVSAATFLFVIGTICLFTVRPGGAASKYAGTASLSDSEVEMLSQRRGSESDRAKAISELARRAGPQRRATVCSALMDFAHEQTVRTTKASEATVTALANSLQTIGLSCGKSAVGFLQRWASDNGYLAQLAPSVLRGEADATKGALRIGAVWGLALTGSPLALKYLKEAESEARSVPAERQLHGVLLDAIEANVEIAKIGTQLYFSQPERQKREKKLLERLRPILNERERRRKERGEK